MQCHPAREGWSDPVPFSSLQADPDEAVMQGNAIHRVFSHSVFCLPELQRSTLALITTTFDIKAGSLPSLVHATYTNLHKLKTKLTYKL